MSVRRRRPAIPKIMGTQLGLSNPGQIDQIKADMLAGRFDFEAGRISGLIHEGVYYVRIGHHRMAAALEILRERGDAAIVLELFTRGKFDSVDNRPNDARPFPGRDWWSAVRNLLRF